MTQIKVCSRCKIGKDIGEFSKSSSARDGRQHACKACRKIIAREYARREKRVVSSKVCGKCHRDKPIDEFYSDKEHIDGHQSVCIECVLVRVALYKTRNRDKVLVGKRTSYMRHRKLVRGGFYDRIEESKNHPEEKFCCRCKEWLPKNVFGKTPYICLPCSRKGYKRIVGGLYEKREEERKHPNEKLCRDCSRWKHLDEFYTNKSWRDGYATYCKSCMIIRSRKYVEENRERLKEKRKIDWAINKEKRKERYKKWCDTKNGKMKNLIKVRRRQAKKLGLPNDLTKDQWELTLTIFENRCAYCGREDEKMQQEHFIPVDLRGSYSIGNIIPACKPCNSSKRNRHPSEWVVREFGQETYDRVVNLISVVMSEWTRHEAFKKEMGL